MANIIVAKLMPIATFLHRLELIALKIYILLNHNKIQYIAK